MRDLQTGLSLDLPAELFQDRDIMVALRACNALADVAKSLVLRIGLFLSAAIIEDNENMLDRAIAALRESSQHLERFADFLTNPHLEGDINTAVAQLLSDVQEGDRSAHGALRQLSDMASRMADHAINGGRLTQNDLRQMTALAHGPFPKWEAAFRERVSEAENRARMELEHEVDVCRRRSKASHARIAEIARVIRSISLNARVEAARAGDAGRAFSVIADEIKALSEQTTAASNDLKQDLNRIDRLLASGDEGDCR